MKGFSQGKSGPGVLRHGYGKERGNKQPTGLGATSLRMLHLKTSRKGFFECNNKEMNLSLTCSVIQAEGIRAVIINVYYGSLRGTDL